MRWIKTALAIMFTAFTAEAYGAVCNVGTVPVNFGSYNTFSSIPNDAEGSVTLMCDSPGVPFTISIDAGVNSGGLFSTRKLKSTTGANTINYNLYTTAAATQIWGDGTGGSATYSGTLQANTGTVIVHGRIPARQSAYVGFYSDSVIVTVMW